jgi:hypothetical protein
MRFDEFNKVTEDIKLPQRRIEPTFDNPTGYSLKNDPLGNYAPGSDNRPTRPNTTAPTTAPVDKSKIPAFQRKGMAAPAMEPKLDTTPTVGATLNKPQSARPSDTSNIPAYRVAGKPEPKIDPLHPSQAAASQAQKDLAKAGVPIKQSANLNIGSKPPLTALTPGQQDNMQYRNEKGITPKYTQGTPTGVLGSIQQGIQNAKRAGAGSDVNTYAGAGGSFRDQQYLNDLKKASVSDPTNKNYQDEIQSIQNRVAKNQGSNDALQRTLGSKFQNTTANNPAATTANPITLPKADQAQNAAADVKARADYASATPAEKAKIQQTTGQTPAQLTSPATTVPVPSAPMNRSGQANAATDSRSRTYAGSGQSSTTSANQTATLPAEKPSASTGNSTPAQSGYKGSAGAQAIQQANTDKIGDVNKIRAGDTIKVGGQDYTIKQGDTLDTIAKNQQSTTPTMTATATPVSNNSEPDFRTQNLKWAQDLAARSEPTPVKPSDADAEKTPVKPTPDMAEDSKSLNRIKSLAGLK